MRRCAAAPARRAPISSAHRSRPGRLRRGRRRLQIACALLPPSPNELTARQAHCAGNGCGALRQPQPLRVQPQSRVGAVAEHRRRQHAWCSARHALMNAAIPALPSVCPMFPLTEPSRHGSPLRVLWTSPRALASIMSPRNVPVPCASTNAICPALNLCEAERPTHQLHLRASIRGGDPVAAAIVVGDGTSHHGIDRLADRLARRRVGATRLPRCPHPCRCRRRLAGTVYSDRRARKAQPACRRSKVRQSE